VFQIMAGVDGKFSNRDWTWEMYVSSGETNTTNFFDDMPSLQRYQNLINAIPSPGGTPNGTWGIGSFTTGRNYAQTCTSGLPIFTDSSNLGAGNVSADCLESIAAKSRSLTKVKQNIAEFNLQGKITDMKAGELRFAVGATTRKNEFEFDPGETNDRESVVENPMSIFASNNTAGSTKVNELYGELLVPVLKKLDLEFGLRESSYADSDIGTTDTYKALFTWRTTDKLSIRGGFQRAERAPNTAELFQGVGLLVVPFAPSDPCSFTTTATWGNIAANPNRVAVQNLCRAIINASDGDPSNDNKSVFDTGAAGPNGFARPGNPFFPLEIELRQGNPNVQPEVGDTYTIGLVTQFDNLTMTFDYYNVKITDAIAPLNSLFAYQQCFNADGASNPTLTYAGNKYCSLILRNVQSGERASVAAPFINTGSLMTDGLDVQVNWRKDLGRGSFYINSLLTFLGKYDVQDAPTTPIVHEKDTLQTQDGGQFKYKATTQFGYNFGGGKTSVGMQWRYLPEIRDESLARSPTSNVFPVASYDSFSLFATYTLNTKINLRMGIDNLTDVQPNIVGARPGDNNAEVTRADYYDILGRRAYIGVKMTF
jgi:outer membrane receptor protein involved in Fe transport